MIPLPIACPGTSSGSVWDGTHVSLTRCWADRVPPVGVTSAPAACCAPVATDIGLCQTHADELLPKKVAA